MKRVLASSLRRLRSSDGFVTGTVLQSATKSRHGPTTGKKHRSDYLQPSIPEELELLSVDKGLVHIDGCHGHGFLLNNSVLIDSPIICYGDLYLHWKEVCYMKDVTPATILPFLDILKPIPDLVVLGSGLHLSQPSSALREALKSHGVALEVSDTKNGAATFNILNQEGRKVVGAFLLPLE